MCYKYFFEDFHLDNDDVYNAVNLDSNVFVMM